MKAVAEYGWILDRRVAPPKVKARGAWDKARLGIAALFLAVVAVILVVDVSATLLSPDSVAALFGATKVQPHS